MTKTLTGITFVVALLVLGMSAQSFAMPMPDKTQTSLLNYAMTKNATLNQLMLVSDAPMTKGGKVVFHLVPKPQEGPDGIQVNTQTILSEQILTSVPTMEGGTMLKFVPKPQEGIDGISLPTSIATPSVSPQPQTISPTQMVLTSVPTQSSTTLKLVPKVQEEIDSILAPKSVGQPTMLVSEPITSKGGMSALHLVPKPAPNHWDSSS